MSKYKSWPHGMFSWVDLSTTDAAAARRFYTELFGWELVDNPVPGGSVYTMASVDGRQVAAFSQLGDEMIAGGMPSSWNSYVSVADVDAAAARAAELGGAIFMPPFDVMDAGRMAATQDPTGAVLFLWQAYNHAGADIFNQHGALSWNELATGDVAAAKSFYCDLFGWSCEEDDSGYTTIKNGDRYNGGMMRIDESWGDVPAHWSVYFGVDDIEQAAKRVVELGGQIRVPPFDMGGAGRGAVVADSTGAGFTLIELNNADPSPELS